MNRKLWVACSMIAALGVVFLLGADEPVVIGATDMSAEALYNKKCAMCHSKDGVAKAMAKGSANLNDPEWQKATSVEEVAKVIAEGKGKMPKNQDKMSPEEIKAVAEYVLNLAAAAPGE